MTSALITGGAGFIGSHLAELLLARGWEVSVVDDLSTGSIRNIEHLKGRPGWRSIIGSITDTPLMAGEVDRADVVFHLAAAVGVRLIVEDPVRTIETNIRGTEIVLELANKKKKRVLITSTSEVYGKNNKVPFREEDDLVLGSTTRPRWSYACSKAIDEFLALAYHSQHKLPVIVVRLFNTVGPRQTGQYGMVIPRFVQQALTGQPLSVYGDGSQTRAFCHVADVVQALLALVEEPMAYGQIFNVGAQREVSILDLAKLVVQLTESKSIIETIPFEKAYSANFEDLARRVPDTTRLRGLVDFQPRKTLEDIIRDVAEHARKQTAPPAWPKDTSKQ